MAITLIKHRLKDSYGDMAQYKVLGEPIDVEGARELAESDPWQFQWWALGLVGARPVEQKRGADKGIDGRIYFHDEGPTGRTKQVIFSVKAGKSGSPHVRDLRGVIERENAPIGILITMQAPTKDMRKEAATAGVYDSPWGDGRQHPRIQLMTVEQLLAGERPNLPIVRDERTRPYRQAPSSRKLSRDKQKKFFDGA